MPKDVSTFQVLKRKVWVSIGLRSGGSSNLEIPVGFDSLVITFHDEPCVFVVFMWPFLTETHATATRAPGLPSADRAL